MIFLNTYCLKASDFQGCNKGAPALLYCIWLYLLVLLIYFYLLFLVACGQKNLCKIILESFSCGSVYMPLCMCLYRGAYEGSLLIYTLQFHFSSVVFFKAFTDRSIFSFSIHPSCSGCFCPYYSLT